MLCMTSRAARLPRDRSRRVHPHADGPVVTVPGGRRGPAAAHRLPGPGDRRTPILCVWNGGPELEGVPVWCVCSTRTTCRKERLPLCCPPVCTDGDRLVAVDTDRSREQVHTKDLLFGGTEPGMGCSILPGLGSNSTKLEQCPQFQPRRYRDAVTASLSQRSDRVPSAAESSGAPLWTLAVRVGQSPGCSSLLSRST